LGRTLHVATVSMTPDLNPDVSRERLCERIVEAKKTHPDLRLIHFGETILGWFHVKGESKAYHRRIAETVPGPTTAAVATLARQLDLYVCFGLSERDGEKVYNTQVLIGPDGRIAAKHRKFWMRSPAFDQGDRALTVADVDDARVVLLICADARSFWLMRAIRRARADIVLASLADYATDARLNRMMGCFYDAWNVVANRCSEEPPIRWPGMITATDRWARLRAHSVNEPTALFVEIPICRSGFLGRAGRRFLVIFKLVGLVAWFGFSCLLKGLTKRARPKSSSE